MPGRPTIHRVEIDFANLQEGGVFALDGQVYPLVPGLGWGPPLPAEIAGQDVLTERV